MLNFGIITFLYITKAIISGISRVRRCWRDVRVPNTIFVDAQKNVQILKLVMRNHITWSHVTFLHGNLIDFIYIWGRRCWRDVLLTPFNYFRNVDVKLFMLILKTVMQFNFEFALNVGEKKYEIILNGWCSWRDVRILIVHWYIICRIRSVQGKWSQYSRASLVR